MPMNITYRGNQVRNPAARFAIVLVAIILSPVIIAVGLVGVIIALLLIPVALPLNRAGCPCVYINGRGRGPKILSYNFK